MDKFILKSKFKPTGDQPAAIEKLVSGLEKKYRGQTLLGVTGSGKTFTMAKVIEAVNRPTLIMSHNKTLAAQLYGEFRQFFPDNAVHYFVSYYDYYQPEAYIPQTDTYIEKESTINEEIDRLRHASTQSLINRRDVLIVASVSCIYGIGEKEDYMSLGIEFRKGQKIKRNELLRQLVGIQFERNDIGFYRGEFRVKGSTVDIHLATGEAMVRLLLSGDRIDNIHYFKIKPSSSNPVWIADLKSKDAEETEKIFILPAKHFMTPEERMKRALVSIRSELDARLKELRKARKDVEAYRLERKTNYDLEMIEQVGYCNGIENYSRHLSDRAPGSPPSTLIDFFPKDYLLFIDESHATIPQIRGMYAGDQSRKETLIEFGFRLPSAKDNRPLNFKEFDKKINQIIYVSATPKEFEIKESEQVAEQIIRPTGLLDPEVEIRKSSSRSSNSAEKEIGGISCPLPGEKTYQSEIRIHPSKNDSQIDDLFDEIEKNTARGQRTLVTTLTKRMAEELSAYLQEKNIKVQYLHSDIETLERVDILRDLRKGEYDVLVGINLLREGLDLPEVSLVAILDADMAGFLRNEISLIQTMGRAARHVEGRVIMYANKITPAIRYAVNETRRRRKKQMAYNKKHGITPRTIKTEFHDSII
ncbi:excinuclease ABC subunit B [Candidatus Falkowbacteria bacterium RIFOXYB2_FULL_47_14]|uniref:Excinuclease ABC subunit B n=1 Tax=Candidatus Falkowbacteria bacterium RIFOXYA2_FULL_47_19 TaxID=1797994 RepID=A0A1F5SJI3_9BACT|nr:MAG: excinuclease ABC subunit B [Candidatus Falkowbacteria bacterium RIFOXYA2_FULL_47_19]OGF35930.1 MAG: excinuclease ABC subunit B [Candidatus Falkowbacteria bacterium RIFOXYC2_FULL_46_15]OGF43932.1 MAG: excinuclease ABC subunit B [Candidatus Falkowbacteria bacterium RIFOXYB2_FULL_47_14]